VLALVALELEAEPSLERRSEGRERFEFDAVNAGLGVPSIGREKPRHIPW
jgi:hypothetical protein